MPANVRGPLTWWRSSLAVRVVSSTLIASTLSLTLLGLLLLGRVTDGLLQSRQQSVLSESSAGLVDAQRIVTSATVSATSATVIADNIVSALAARAGQPPLYDVLLLAGPRTVTTAPERGTNLVLQASVPTELRDTVANTSRQAWTYTTIRYLDGRSVTGLVVGAPLLVPGVGEYGLFTLYPLTQEQQTLELVRSAVLVTGILLIILLSVIGWVVTSQVVAPIRAAAATAERLSAGRLTERLAVRGQDDLAKLAIAFNDMASALQEQIRRLETLSRLQQRFVSDVSHELRTPLTTVRMAADMLYDSKDELDDATARASELLVNQLDRFEALLSDLLEISRFDAGAAVLDLERVDVVALVRNTSAALEPVAAKRGSHVQIHTPIESVAASIDPRRVDRILRNLIANAIEHGEGQPIDITIASDEQVVTITVRDHGLGLKPGEAALVFNRFWRSDPSRQRTLGGTGLGLSIALEDARLHGGWLEAWGAPRRGANFRMVLPREAGGDVTYALLPLDPDDVESQVTV